MTYPRKNCGKLTSKPASNLLSRMIEKIETLEILGKLENDFF